MPRLAESYRLAMDSWTLKAELATDHGNVQSEIRLPDTVLVGNQQGKFVQGEEFRGRPEWQNWYTSRLEGTKLKAKLRPGKLHYHQEPTKDWIADELDLDKLIFWSEDRLVAGRVQDASEKVALTSKKAKFHLHGGELHAVIDSGVGKINLDTKLGNNNGAFHLDGVNFSMSARHCVIDDTILRADLRQVDGLWVQSQIDLATFVEWDNNALRFCPLRVLETPIVSSPLNCERCGPLFYHGRFRLPFEAAAVRLIPPPRDGKCPMCTLLRLLLRRTPLSVDQSLSCIVSPSYHISAWRRTYRQALVNMQSMGTRPKTTVSKDSSSWLVFHRADTQPSSSLFRGLPQSPMPDLWFEPDRRWSFVNEWLANCPKNHKGGCKHEAWSPLPARILDLSQVDQDIVHLVIPEGECERYACLSHRWGGKMPVTLTTTSIENFRTGGLKLSALPRTFRDVITVCQKIGMHYLWIDSLCIQQDSQEDWEIESTKMASYYGNCFVCIAATSSRDSESGWTLRERPSAVKLTGVGPDGLPYRMIAYPENEIREYDQSQHFTQISEKEMGENFPLLRRAWAYQERRLAPRVLHLCEHEVVLECETEIVCECGGCKTFQVNWTKAMPFPDLRSYQAGRTEPRSLPIEHDAVWTAECSTYSSLELTFATDKLMAISGLAASFGLAEKTYLAGLRHRYLFTDMCWHVGPEITSFDYTISSAFSLRKGERRLASRDRPEKSVAPSWSWASVTEPVSFVPVATVPAPIPFSALASAEVLRGSEDMAGPRSPVSHLTFRALLLSSTWALGEADGDGNKWYTLNDVLGIQQQFLVIGSFGQYLNTWMGGDPYAWVPTSIRFLPDYDIGQDVVAEDHLFLMPLQSETTFMLVELLKHDVKSEDVIRGFTGEDVAPSLQWRKVTALVLRKIKDLAGMSEPVYERVGFTYFVAESELCERWLSMPRADLGLI